jgi:deoxyribonuclease-4
VGAHIFVAGGLARTGLTYAREIGAEAIQVFVSNPRGWRQSAGDAAQDSAFVEGCAASKMTSYVHAPYLINFGSPNPVTLENSLATMRHSLRRGREIGARGVVVHAGCQVAGHDYDVAMRQVREHVRPLLDELRDDDPDLLIELTAGGKGSLAATPDGLAAYLEVLDRHPRAGVCVDTCHAMAAGHDLSEPGGLRRFLTAIAKAAGRGRLKLVHANDSRDAVGSGRDRHEAVGQGSIGIDAFRELFVHPATKGVPVLIETAGKVEDHRRDVALLKSLRDL